MPYRSPLLYSSHSREHEIHYGTGNREEPEYWQGMFYCLPDTAREIQGWCRDILKGKYSMDYRFNSGDPALFYTFRDKDDVLLFKLAWCGEDD